MTSSFEDEYSIKNIMKRMPESYLDKYTYAERKAKAIRIRQNYLQNND